MEPISVEDDREEEYDKIIWTINKFIIKHEDTLIKRIKKDNQ